MHTVNRAGFTLVELIMALALGALVAGAIYQVVTATQRVSHSGVEQIDVRQNMRAGVTYLVNVLRELDAVDGDITVATSTKLQFRSMRWTGILCAAPAAGTGSSVTLPIRATPLFGLRAPDAVEDSLLVYRDGDPSTRADDSWLVGALTGTASRNCTDGSGAHELTVQITAASGGRDSALVGVIPGTPIRGFQTEELSLFQGTDGRWWMGQRTANRSGTWTAVRALIGPLTADGLSLAYYDTTGAVTGTLTEIATVAVTVRGESRDRVRSGVGTIDYARDSLITRVALRNNPRF